MSKKKEEPLRISERVDTYYKTWCPYCHEANWVNNGDVSDISGTDVERIRCHACKKVFLISEEIEGLGDYDVTEGVASP